MWIVIYFLVVILSNGYVQFSRKVIRVSSELFSLHSLPASMETKDISKAKGHKNKYSKFSKKESMDPLEEAIAKANLLEVSRLMALQASSRGTTVPTVAGSTNISNTLNKQDCFQNISISNIVPSDPYTFGYIRIGSIINVHGVKGELKIKFETDFIETRIKANSVLFVKKPNRLSPRPIKVMSGRKQVDDMYLIFFDGITTRMTAAALKGYEVFVKSSDHPTLNVDEYLIRDLVGLHCYLTDSLEYPVAIVEGVVPPDELCSHAVASLMHSMLEVRKIGTKELSLIPFVPEIVLSVDLISRKIVLNPPKGLLEISYEEKQTKVAIKGFLPQRAGEYLKKWERVALEKDTSLRLQEGGESVAIDEFLIQSSRRTKKSII